MDKRVSDKPGLFASAFELLMRPFGLLMTLILAGCAATLTPPPAVSDPLAVYVLDHGRHNSLVLVLADDHAMRYALGEWEWYAEGRTGLGRSFQALFMATPSALGRVRLEQPLEPDCWVGQVGSEIFSVLAFVAEREQVEGLAADIDQQFEQSSVPPGFRPGLNLEFIPGPRPYTLGQNSNHQVVEWLEILGFEVRGVVAFGAFRPASPQFSFIADSSACSAVIHSPSS